MLYLAYYLIFAIATALTAQLFLVSDVLAVLEELEPENPIVLMPWVSRFVLFALSLMVAPLLVLPLLVPSLGESFQEALLEGLLDQE